MNKQPAIYLLTNKTNGTLYTGVTSDLPKRVWQHKNGISKRFCTKYNLTKLVYFELFENMYQAISREKQMKSKKQTDRKHQSGVARSVSGYSQLKEIAASLRDSQ
jgi:putative endonuclease